MDISRYIVLDDKMMRQLFDRKIHDIKKHIIVLTLFAGLLLSACGKTEAVNSETLSQISEGTQNLQTESIQQTEPVVELKSEAEPQQEFQPEPKPESQPKSKPSEEPSSEIPTPEPPQEEDPHPYDFTICFAGDINLDENWCTTQYLNIRENGIKDCISPELLTHMNSADIMCLNNEFTYSLRGTPLNGKAYTFRANPERVEILHEMGVDIVKLANNHVYDYGKDALLDTFETLENAGIAYMGAGRNLEQAMAPVYIELDGKTIAFVAASRAEKNKMTPQATEEKPGILRCYDIELFLEVIKEARANADFVLAYVHWGTEYSYDLEEVQLTTGKDYLDAGADVIIGAHSHCLQGMEYYDGKPIIYSLGNYWFNEKTLDTMLLDLHFYGDDENSNLDVNVIPAIQSGYCTNIVTEQEEKERIYSFLEGISMNVAIDETGLVLESEE